jgi:hypothetical protein
MNSNQDLPPSPKDSEPRDPAFVAAYVAGVVVGLILSFFFLMILFAGIGVFSGNNSLWAVIISFGAAGLGILGIVKPRRRWRGARRPFDLGVLTGLCILGLLFGFCFMSLGPFKPG